MCNVYQIYIYLFICLYLFIYLSKCLSISTYIYIFGSLIPFLLQTYGENTEDMTSGKREVGEGRRAGGELLEHIDPCCNNFKDWFDF